MTVSELIAKLQAAPSDARVVFDTDAGAFDVHLVEISDCVYEPGAYDGVMLTTRHSRLISWEVGPRSVVIK